MADLFEHASAPARAAGLNPEQKNAVHHGEGPLVVVAGAGTGKTRVITERIRYLLESQPQLTGEEILGLTFTDKAAAEMKHRVVSAVGERGKAVTLATFHSFCSELLQQASPGLRPIDKVDQWILLRRNLPLLGLERYRRLTEPGKFLNDFVEFFSRCQDELVSPDDYQAFAERQGEAYARVRAAMPESDRLERDEEIAKLLELAGAYRASDRLARERNLLTFGMQIMDAVVRLRQDKALREQLQGRYRWLLVDEFQDTNITQLELLWQLGGERPNLVVVGDHRQAIYRFRGASFGSFSAFLQRFAGTAPRELLQPLTLNYRSSGRILRVASEVIRHNERPADLPEYPLSPAHPDGEKVRILTHPSAAAEAAWMAAELERQHAAGVKWRSFAVLYRIHTHRDRLVEELKARKIPFVIHKLSILSHALVRDLTAYLRLLDRPADDIACARVLAMPAWRLEAADLVRLCQRAAKEHTSLWEALEAAQGEPWLAAVAGRVEDLKAMVSALRNRSRSLTASELLDELAAQLSLESAASADERKYFEQFRDFVREWQPKSETQHLRELVQYLEYFEQAGGSINLKEETGGAIQLMTVHAAKGLEFDRVFILRVVKGAFPLREKASVLEFPEELMKENRPAGDFNVQEERRLFYVAITRARHQLTLSTVENTRTHPSPFLDQILADPQLKRRDIEQLAPVPPAGVGAAPGAAGAAAKGGAELFPASTTEARVGSRIGEWAGTYRPPVPSPLMLSVSTIGTMEQCPQRYLFQSAWGIRGGPAAPLTFGSVMHTTIQHFIGELTKGRKLPFAEVQGKFELEWRSAGFEDDYQEQEYKKDGLAQLRALYDTVLAHPPEVIAQEKRFELPMENDVVLTGRIDQVNRIAAGEQEIVDYKTGRPRDARSAGQDLQLGVYALAGREVFEWNPTRLTFYYLQNNAAVSTSRTEKELNKVRSKIQEAAADIRAGHFPAKVGYLCKYCEYEPICPAQEQGSAASAESDQ